MAAQGADAWDDVGLPIALLEKRFAGGACQASEQHEEACVLALEALASHRTPPARIDWSAEPPALEPAPDAPALPAFEARVAREVRAIEAYRGRGLGVAPNFKPLWQALRSVAEARPGGPRALADALRSYLRRVEDPHTELAPYRAVERSLHQNNVDPVRSFLTRDRNRPESVAFSRLYERGFSLGWVALRDFDDVACGNVSYALSRLLADGIQGVLLDLRGNGGGVAREADCVLDLFFDRGVTLYRLEPLREGGPARSYTTPGPALTDLPLVVLIDAGTASGAEIIAGVVQAQGRGRIVGERSFGKGTYQRASPWSEHDGVVLYQTVARIVVEPGFEFQNTGVFPDVVWASSGPVLREATAYVNPIPPRYPSVPTHRFSWGDTCPREAPRAAIEPRDAALALSRRVLHCELR